MTQNLAQPLKLLDLFSGIGGFSLGLERTGGFQTVAFCEIDPFCRRVLAKHWPEVPCYDDVRTLTAERLVRDGVGPIDAICGGFPCQDISKGLAVWGDRQGTDGARSGLYREAIRLADELRPAVVILENVSTLLSAGFGHVLRDLAAVRYDAEWHCISAAAVGFPHGRDRLWIVAYPVGERDEGLVTGLGAGAAGSWRESGSPDLLAGDPFEPGDCWPERLVRRVDDGFSSWAHRIGALGNAVVPQIPELIGRAILAALPPSSAGDPPHD